jgi:hypothetical protein
MRGLLKGCLFFGALLCGTDVAANAYPWRTVYFEANSLNSTVNSADAGSSFQSTCILSISNPSSQNQNVQLALTVTSSGVGAGSGWLCTTCGGEISAAGAISLAAGQTRTFIYNYPVFPALTQGEQSLVCRGTIEAQDVANGSFSGQLVAGFIVASGSITNWTQSTRGYQVGVAGAFNVKGVLNQSQVQITINQGRPF